MVEYALILALVAIAVVVLLTVAGQRLGEIFCDTVIKIGGKVSTNIQMCAAPRITITGIAGGQTVSGDIVVEAIIQDDELDQPNDIASVNFYIDGTQANHQQIYPYCLHGGGNCDGYSTHLLSDGQHTLRVVAEDADHNIAETRITFNVQNHP